MYILRIAKKLETITLWSILLFLGSSLVTSCIGTANKQFIKKKQFVTYDAVIVPGVPFENGEWSDIMKLRVYWSYYLYKKGIAKNIIYSGSAVYSPYVEAKIMAAYAQKLGIPKEHIFVEPRAEHSTENLYYSYKIAQENNFEKIALASDPFQSSFLQFFARKTALNSKIEFIPIAFKELKNIEMSTPEIDPSPAFVGKNFISLPERETFAMRWRGTMGKYIKYEEGDEPKTMRKNRRQNKRFQSN